MLALPVIERELRSASRHPITYNLRVLGALALLGVLAMFWLQDGGGAGAGARLFNRFHQALFFSIWILVPLLTADCISRERREGTLPLLFLTPLSAADVVYAKGLAHGLRSFTLWLAVLPIITVCFLAGGVDWRQISMSVLVNFSSVCLGLGAGVLASSVTRIWTRALAGSAVIAFGLLLGCGFLLTAVMMSCWRIAFGRPVAPWHDVFASPDAAFTMAVQIDQVSQAPVFRRGPGVLLCTYALTALVCAITLWLLSRIAAWNLGRTWQERPLSKKSIWVREKLFRPMLFQKQLRTWLRWQLNRNPIGWLEQRSWSGRLVVWSWFAVVLCVYSSLFSNMGLYQRGFHHIQTVLAALLAGSIASSAAGSFRRERETGVLELLLVAPIRESQIIAGRIKGLWTQFLPAIVLLSGVWVYAATFLSGEGELLYVLQNLVNFATIPLVGLYFSLAKPTFIGALVWTLLVQLILPAAAVIGFKGLDIGLLQVTFVQALVQCAVAAFLGARLLRMLKRREFLQPVA
ncbi:MAG TPA: ABC transporter permease subunit [Verrucomicrobiae bacterium]|nr:ABC transporter permease subunit [Verrucomicrobiae bacterium]